MIDPLERALKDIQERKSHQSGEVVVRRYDGPDKCGMRRYGKCYHEAIFEIRGEVRVRVCASCIEHALAYLLEPLAPLDDLEGHIGRHSSIVTRSECAHRPYRMAGTRPKPLDYCYACSRQRGKKKRCSVCHKNYTHGRCICLAVICGKCFDEHTLREGGFSHMTARGIIVLAGHEVTRRHRMEYGGIA